LGIGILKKRIDRVCRTAILRSDSLIGLQEKLICRKMFCSVPASTTVPRLVLTLLNGS
jgi:hypothetical protein